MQLLLFDANIWTQPVLLPPNVYKRSPAHAERQLQQDVPGAYVEAQIAVLTSGNMAISLQMQLNETILNPQGLLTTLQQNGLAVTNISLQSLYLEQVGRVIVGLDNACSMLAVHTEITFTYITQ